MLQRTSLHEADRLLRRWGKMLFVSGPRQVGKTTLAKELLERSGSGTYFNWDILTDRSRLADDPYFFARVPRRSRSKPLVVFDEIHKYARWKSYLKGVYDRYGAEYRVIVTGSGRLDLFQRGGDSLLGRYTSLPLLPLSIGELLDLRPTWKQFRSNLSRVPEERSGARRIFDRLMRFGGFPEPYVKGKDDFYSVWGPMRTQLLVREDIRDATNLRNLSLLEQLVQLLPPRVGRPLSTNSLREDLGVAFETVRDWLEVLGNFYYLFRVPPYSQRLSRSLRKEPKLFLFDWAQVGDSGARFENLVALHLLKAVRTWSALGEGAVDLHYVRDKEKHEVDFLITEKNEPVLLVECKLSDEKPSPHLTYFQDRLDVPVAVQLVHSKSVAQEWRRDHGKMLLIISADTWLPMLP